jgi:hypothetical protein
MFEVKHTDDKRNTDGKNTQQRVGSTQTGQDAVPALVRLFSCVTVLTGSWLGTHNVTFVYGGNICNQNKSLTSSVSGSTLSDWQ